MLSYTVAIRTLALAPETLLRVIEGVFSQTVAPRSVRIYIAEGYAPPQWRVADERYISVPKGMMSQRLLDYEDVDTDCILMLDDDLVLGADVSGRLLEGMEQGGYDLMGADVCCSSSLSLLGKIKAAAVNLTLPHFNPRKGFVMRPSGSFSYPLSPEPLVLPSDTCAGPLMLWRVESYRALHLKDELWLECEGFSYADDALISYKAVVNGMRVGVDFGADVTNLDTRTSSNKYRNDPRRHFIRAKLITMAWWRMNYRPSGTPSIRALIHGTGKLLWMGAVMTAVSIATLSPAPLMSALRGWRQGLREARRLISPYVMAKD
ncbi:MAG: hypothetical protein J1E29_01430 [Duncaniella sp.]|nr:hypothetical protein [Duncaniella sp.]